MICFRDTTYCLQRDCEKYDNCNRNYDKTHEFVKRNYPNLPICVAMFTQCYQDKKEKKYDECRLRGNK